MISKETAGRIWNCYHDIETGEKLLSDMVEEMKNPDTDANPRDHFGRKRCLTLGIPTGDCSHRMLDVKPRLAISVIKAHIAEKTKDLAEANEQARIELGEPTPCSP